MTNQIRESKHLEGPENHGNGSRANPDPDFDVAEAFDEFLEAFNEFKATNDERLEQLEKRGTADTLTRDKLSRLDNALTHYDQMILKAARPPLGGHGEDTEARAAMNAYVRKGRTDGYEGLESKGMSVGSEADGGYLVPDETETTLLTALRDESPIRSLASTLTISTSLPSWFPAPVPAGWRKPQPASKPAPRSWPKWPLPSAGRKPAPLSRATA